MINNSPCIGSMVPIISVTPHSPSSKYNCILEDTLNHLQCIRESVVQMKNAAFHPTTLSKPSKNCRLFSSCPSIPDLTALPNVAITSQNSLWPTQNRYLGAYPYPNDRRKSWAAVDDYMDCAKGSQKSISLSSLDSEEQESLRAAKRIVNRSCRNSTGGISTHSLNEAELAHDFERILAKRNLTPIPCRIPLQKSISTPSIAPLRTYPKDKDTPTPARNLSDSEDEIPDDHTDDISLICVRDKQVVYADHPEKRRKRGSLFFRKKKDKTKTKGSPSNCDACGANIKEEHAADCKGKLAKNPSKSGMLGKKGSIISHNSHHDDQDKDTYDGHNEHSNYTDETPLFQVQFLNEPPIGPDDLGADPILGVAKEEHDSWSPSVPKEIVKSLKDKQQIKRQEHIYEFIMTEKHHCQTLLVIQKVFADSLHRHFQHLNLDRLFPRLTDLIELHTSFLKELRIKQRKHAIIDSIADILLDFFSSTSAQQLKSAYGEFCSNHRTALDTFKYFMTDDHTFAEWYKHCLTNPLLKKKGIPECILFVTQRLTKYPLLIDPLLKSSREDKVEQEKLQKAMECVKTILIEVDGRVAEKDKDDRQVELSKRVDPKSFAVYRKEKFKKSDIIASRRKLKFEGIATLMQGRSKMQTVTVVVLTDCLFFLQENSHKFTFFTPENKAGVVSLQKLLIREKAGSESRGIYIISSDPAYPEMYELKVQSPKDKNVWIQAIRAAVVDCPMDCAEMEDYPTAEQQLKISEARQASVRETIDKLRNNDISHAIVLEEKIELLLTMLHEMRSSNDLSAIPSIDTFFAMFGSYRDLITDDCDTLQMWKRVVQTVKETSYLASSLYTAATGLPLSRSSSKMSDKLNDLANSPILPKRAETFGGFDERRLKQNPHWRDAVFSTLPANVINYDITTDNKSRKSSNASDIESISPMSPSVGSSQDQNFAAVQISHNLHLLLCIISQQMTVMHNLQSQMSVFRENPKSVYRHNDQLEELRNLQDKLREEKTSWLKEKETQEHELDEKRRQQEELQKQIKAEQEDIEQQRSQLYKKMEILSNQGLLLSPNVSLPVPNQVANNDDQHQLVEDHYSDRYLSNTDPRKDKWRATISKTPPANLHSATNAPKVNQSSVKQQLPFKLSSSTSTKPDKTSPNNSVTSPISSSGSISQLFPLKLADKKAQNVTPSHSRTGSSPAVIQQLPHTPTGNPAARTNTYPKLSDRYRLRSSDRHSKTPMQEQQRPASSTSGIAKTSFPSQHQSQTPTPTRSSNNNNDKNQEEEVIYF